MDNILLFFCVYGVILIFGLFSVKQLGIKKVLYESIQGIIIFTALWLIIVNLLVFLEG